MKGSCRKLGYTVDTGSVIIELMSMVAERLAFRYESVKKEVTGKMYGEVLNYPTKVLLNWGRAEGKEIGKEEGKLESVEAVMKNTGASFDKACEMCGLNSQEKSELLKMFEKL